MLNYIECVNVPFKSKREEFFKDISLPVKGVTNIYDSLHKYVEIETLEEEN